MTILKVKNKDYLIKYNFRALSEMQDRGINLSSESEFRLKDIVGVLHIGLKAYQKEMTFDDVFDLMDEIMEEITLGELMEIIREGLEKSMGKSNPNPNK